MPSDWIMPPLIWLSRPRRLSGRPTSWTWTILIGLTWPVSTSTSTSAKHTPWTPVEARLFFHSPRSETPAAGSAAHACFHCIDLPPPLTLPPSYFTSSGLQPRSGATALLIALRALNAASLIAGARDAVVVDPPDG